MTKLTIGKCEEREPEVGFWLESCDGNINIMARMDGSEQAIAKIGPDGRVCAISIYTRKLIAFFGTNRPFAGLR